MKLHSKGLGGKDVILKENAVFSSKVTQPILCYGRLMEHGWRINGREQVLENGGVKVPLQLQNSIKTLIARGRVRIISNEDEDCFEAQVS